MEWFVRPRPDVLPTDREFVNIAFFDTYFSNFIEGTKFQVGDAREIVFEGKIPAARPREAHYAQEYAWRIDFSDYESALATLVETEAFEEVEGRSTLAVPDGEEKREPKLRLPVARSLP